MWQRAAGIAVGLMVGCSTAVDPGSTPVVPPETFPEAPDEPEPTGSTTDGPEMQVYALYERNVEAVSNPNPLESTTADGITHSIKRIVFQEGDASYDEQLCLAWGNEVFGTTWAFAPDFPTQRGILQRPFQMVPGKTFEAGPFLDLLGTDLTSGALPTEPDEPGVVDTDEDGEPGHTMFITNNTLGQGEVYIVQRSSTVLSGEFVDSFRATGSVATDTESNTVDASTWWLDLQGPANAPNPEASFFVLLRVNPEMDCEAIYEDRESLALMVRPT